jgi:hypothetical protein
MKEMRKLSTFYSPTSGQSGPVSDVLQPAYVACRTVGRPFRTLYSLLTWSVQRFVGRLPERSNIRGSPAGVCREMGQTENPINRPGPQFDTLGTRTDSLPRSRSSRGSRSRIPLRYMVQLTGTLTVLPSGETCIDMPFGTCEESGP